VGNRLADGLGVADADAVRDAAGDAVRDAAGDAVRDAAGDADVLADGLVEALGVTPGVPAVAVAVPPCEAPDVAEPVTEGEPLTEGEAVTEGENTDGGDEDEDAEQAETVADASMVKVPQHMAISLALSGVPALVPRTFIEPPHAPGR
jgi:hypothetical protein